MVAASLPEREPHPRVHADIIALLKALDCDTAYPPAYVRLELDLLAELGYGLDLSRCAATGARNDLTHVSPRSGQAVSAAAAAPYRERLLVLPRFLLDDTTAPSRSDIVDGLTLTGFFLDRRVFHAHGRKMPAARMRFVDLLRRTGTLAAQRFESA
jgi:DNA repair protein RecO (recombination protein O)